MVFLTPADRLFSLDAMMGMTTCSACADGKGCGIGPDCLSKVCTGGKCPNPTCSDTVKNGNETDIDCGGAACSKCAAGLACATAADCSSGVCTGNVCKSP